MTHIDGFVIPVPAGNRDAYRDVAAKAAPIFKGCGATRIAECRGDHLPDGEVADFGDAVKAGAEMPFDGKRPILGGFELLLDTAE